MERNILKKYRVNVSEYIPIIILYLLISCNLSWAGCGAGALRDAE
jgi:hypothetical protein